MWDGFSSSFHCVGLGFHFFGDKRAVFAFLLLDAVSSWSSARLHGIDFYFFLNSGFLRVRPANWYGEGLSYIFFPREEFPFRILPAEGWA